MEHKPSAQGQVELTQRTRINEDTVIPIGFLPRVVECILEIRLKGHATRDTGCRLYHQAFFALGDLDALRFIQMKNSKRTVNIAGIWVHVYSRYSESSPDSGGRKSVSALFLLHGRLGAAQDGLYENIVYRVLDEVSSLGADSASGKDLIIVTFDHRNHGTRLLDGKANKGWDLQDLDNHNENHALDMYAIQTGTARDVSFLIDFLPSYLYPDGNTQIVDWIVSGISLGGHSAWIVLKNEPRVKIGIPIIGCPDYLKLIELRAAQKGLSLEPPLFPSSLRAYATKNDPASAPAFAEDAQNPFIGKKILILSGAKDKLVLWEAGADFIDKLNVGRDGVKEIIIEESAGHECTRAMQQALAQFVWKFALERKDVHGAHL